MEISVITNIILSTLSFLLAVISIVFVIITLKQNNKILEESTRPNITIFFDSITAIQRTNFFVIKNFGNSSGIIKKFIYTDELKSSCQAHNLLNEQFDCIENIVLAPGQSKLLPYNVSLLETSVLHFEIKYTSSYSQKEYTEIVDIDIKKASHIPVSKPNNDLANECFCSSLLNLLHELIEKQI